MTMLGRLLGLVALALLAGCGKQPETSEARPALWEVAGEDGVQGWLFGTVHSLPANMRWQTPPIRAALAKADLLAVELAGLDDRPAMAALFARFATTPGQPPLPERVPAADRGELGRALDKAGYDAGDFRSVETWAAGLTLAQALRENGGEAGADAQLLRDWGARPVLELEGLAGQLAIFDRLPESEQVDLLLAIAEDGLRDDGGESPTERWARGDLAGLEREMQRGMLADPELREALLVRRNRDWAQQLQQQLAAGRHPFVAVGAAHLLGPDGLVALMERRGYEIRRVQ